MFNLELNRRKPAVNKSTIGDVFYNGGHFCYSLEDIVRPEDEPKVFGETAIPAGSYDVVINRSNRFSKIAGHDVYLPQILNVPGFEGVRIHSGNRPEDTEGCILLGLSVTADKIGQSRDAMKKFFDTFCVNQDVVQPDGTTKNMPVLKDKMKITIS